MLPRLIPEHLVRFLARATQRRRVIDLFAVLIGIARKARLLSARLRRCARLVLVLLRSHLVTLSFADAFVPTTISNLGALPVW